jgi:glycosyltransferase involved in cell wall biosynthesis
VTYKRLVYAPNIHQGGGKALLLPLLLLLKDAEDVIFVLDSRLNLPSEINLLGVVHRVNPTLCSRLNIERILRKIVTPKMYLLCMGNLPPLLAHQGNQKVFVQNRYLVENISLSSFPIAVHVRLMVERWWLRSRAKYVNTFIVQTATMKRLIKNTLDVDATLLPYAVLVTDNKKPINRNKTQFDFLYVASGEPHKNHKILVDSWVKLAERGHFPSLCLTLDRNRDPDLCEWISERITEHQLNIALIGECSYEVVQNLYNQSRAMLYPSLFESFGLPLIEAVSAGLPVLASNASYVTDVIEPSDVFDPNSAEAIANAVQHFCYNPSSLKIHLFDTDEFLSRVFREERLD